MPLQLIITSDDCGLSEGINLATARLHESGMISAASIMTNFGAVAHALDLFSDYPLLELGVHLTLSDGYPVSNIGMSSAITRSDGSFRDRLLLYVNGFFPSQSLRQTIRDELRAQIDVLTDAGVRPQHLTTHTHFHIIPALGEIVAELAEEYKVRWVRASSYKTALIPFNPAFSRSEDTSVKASFLVPDYLVGLRYWLEKDPEEMFVEINSLDGIVELIAHPSTEDDETYPREVRYHPAERHREMRYLERFCQILEGHQHDIHIGLASD